MAVVPRSSNSVTEPHHCSQNYTRMYSFDEGIFSAVQMVPLKNTSSLRKRKRRLLTALFHFVAKVQQFANPRLLIKAAVSEFIGKLILDNAVGIA